MTPIRVNINYGKHSTGRGVGFYAENLISSLTKIPDIILTDNHPDLVHFPFFDLFYPTLPLAKPLPTVVTIHDLTPLILKDKYPKGLRGSLILARQRSSLINVKAIITDSENSKTDLIQVFKVSQDKIFVTPLGVNPLFYEEVKMDHLNQINKKYQLPKKFILTVAGGPNPNKNLPLLAEVTKKLDIPLLIVGRGLTQDLPAGPVHPELSDLFNLRKFTHIITPGFVPTDDLSAIYRLASAYCQPSLYEGFGLPLLEAMASGCLLISSYTSCLPEVFPSGTISFDPHSETAMTRAIEIGLSLSDTDKKARIKIAKDHARAFTWDRTAEATLKVYKQVLNEN